MTVGVPEISLDTWGLKYVKKKKQPHEVTEGEMGKIGYSKPISETIGQAPSSVGSKRSGDTGSKSPAETKPDQFMRDDEAATSNPRTRQQDQVPDTNTSVTSRGGKIGERWQQHEHQQDKYRIGGQKKETSRTTGRQEGATDTPTKTGQALDAKGQVKHGKTHTGTEGRNLGDPSTDPKRDISGHKIKPAKQGESLSPSAKPSRNIQRAVLDLAVIKCKLLKMKTKKKDFIEECRPSRAAYRKDDDEDEKVEKRNVDDEKYSQGKYNRHHSEAGIQSGEITPHPNPVKGKKTEDTKYFSQRGEELGSGKEGKKRFESDSKKSDDIVEKAIELINEAYDEMKSTDFRKLKPTYEGDTKEAKKAKGDYCTHCGSKKDKEPQTEAEQVGESLTILEQEEAKNISPPEEEDTKKAEGSTSTGDVGAANFVYSDVHEKKKQEETTDDGEETEEDWDHAARNDDGSLPSSLDKYKDPKVL